MSESSRNGGNGFRTVTIYCWLLCALTADVVRAVCLFGSSADSGPSGSGPNSDYLAITFIVTVSRCPVFTLPGPIGNQALPLASS